MEHHRRGLRRLWTKEGIDPSQQQKLLDALTNPSHGDPWNAADLAMLSYARKLTLAPHSVNERDIQELRARGFDDRAIHDMCAVTAYFAFVNRIADGLGVELESDLGA